MSRAKSVKTGEDLPESQNAVVRPEGLFSSVPRAHFAGKTLAE